MYTTPDTKKLLLVPALGAASLGLGYFLYSFVFMSTTAPTLIKKKKKKVKYEVQFDQRSLNDFLEKYLSCYDQCLFKEARHQILGVIKMVRNELGDRHPLMGSMLYHLYEVHREMEHWVEASDALDMGIKILEDYRDKERMNLRMMYDGKVRVDIVNENIKSAKVFAERFKETFKRGEDENLAEHLSAYIEMHMGNLENALEIFERVTPSLLAVFGYNLDNIVYHFLAYSDLYLLMGNPDEAMMKLEEFLEGAGMNSKNSLPIFEKLGDIYFDAQDFVKCEEMRNKCVELSSLHHIKEIRYLNNLATLYVAQDQRAKADELLTSITSKNGPLPLTNSTHFRTKFVKLSRKNGGKTEVDVKLLLKKGINSSTYQYTLEPVTESHATKINGKGTILSDAKILFLTIPIEQELNCDLVLTLSLANGSKHVQLIKLDN